MLCIFHSKSSKSIFRQSLLAMVICCSSGVSYAQQLERNQKTDQICSNIKKMIDNRIANELVSFDFYYQNGKKIKVDSILFSTKFDTLQVFCSSAMAEMPLRSSSVKQLKDSIVSVIPDSLKNISLQLYAGGVELNQLIPNFYVDDAKLYDKSKFAGLTRLQRKNVVSKPKPFDAIAGLEKSNIALWNSHGWYYEQKLGRWEWQRARLFTTLEDISPTSFVIPYLAPMLENAGATVFLPRERDWQSHEVIVDNNGSTGKSKLKASKSTKKDQGFSIGERPYTNENPFKSGTYLECGKKSKYKPVVYLPDFPEEGEYGVYVSYGKGSGEVTYRVFHTGGFTDFQVDQRMGYGTWIYLDKFLFRKGKNDETGKVVILAPKDKNQVVTADAVRFGGGMGQIVRYGQTSGRARFFEGARYYLQAAGAPDTLVWSFHKGEDDYKDDYKSRGEWVNWLMGNPFGPSDHREEKGLQVPVDLSFAFHTDAGILPNDKIVGTLGIYSSIRDDRKFPDGQSKLASRDLTDLIQTQIVDDLHRGYHNKWTRRGMWDSEYSEAYRPNVPTMLLELLSHQNLTDVRYLLEPQFKFDVSRAIYKGMLRFIATQNNYPYVVQPLPVDHLSAEFTSEKEITLKWAAVADSLEATAMPDKYMVYTAIDDNGFDNGQLSTETQMKITIPQEGKVYRFKVTAVNQGGESFPSEEIAVGIAAQSKGKVLIVNGFDRIDGPEVFETDSLSGVMRQLDQGVAYRYDMCTVGDQYDFVRKSIWTDDDNPGLGASYADLETTIFRGNTFDFAAVHGKSILNAGYSFVTASDEVMEDGLIDMNQYLATDLLYGEEKTSSLPGDRSTPRYSIYNEKMLTALEKYTQQGGNIFISGSYIGTDMPHDTLTANRIKRLLKFRWRTDHAVKNVNFVSVSPLFKFDGEVNTDYNLQQYPAEAPDAIEPADKEGQTILRYPENNTSAAVAVPGKYKIVAFGFPFECVKNQATRDDIFRQIFDFFEKN